jgi:methionine aminotransferase
VFSSKLPAVGVSIFSVMTRLANEYGAINLSQGFPDFACDPALVEAVARAMREGHNQYAPMPGVQALREAIAAKVRHCYGAPVDPVTEGQVTCGATEALYSTLTAFDRGDYPPSILPSLLVFRSRDTVPSRAAFA